MQVPDFITQWVDARIEVATAALGKQITADLKEDIDAIPAAVATELQALSAGLQSLEGVPQQVVAAVTQLVENLPAEITQAIEAILPHFLQPIAKPPAQGQTERRRDRR